MPDPAVEDFGAGIVQQQQQPPQVPANLQVAQAPAPSALLAELGTKLNGLDGMTIDSFADTVVDWQEKANRVAALEAEKAAWEAEKAAFVASQTKGPGQPAAPETPASSAAAAARQRRYEAKQVDPDLFNLCQYDAEGQCYAPKNVLSPAHISAAQQLNDVAAHRRRISDDITSDPYDFGEEILHDRLAALEAKLEAKYDARLNEVTTKLTPLEQQYQDFLVFQSQTKFEQEHRAKLFKEDGQLTQIGALVDDAIKAGVAPDQALVEAERAARVLGLVPESPSPAAPAKPASISRIQQNGQQQSASGNRFIDRLSNGTREMIQKPDSEVGNGKKNPSHADIAKKYGVFGPN